MAREPDDAAVLDFDARRAHAREALAHVVGCELDALAAFGGFPRAEPARRVLEIDVHQLAEARHAEAERGTNEMRGLGENPRVIASGRSARRKLRASRRTRSR